MNLRYVSPATLSHDQLSTLHKILISELTKLLNLPDIQFWDHLLQHIPTLTSFLHDYFDTPSDIEGRLGFCVYRLCHRLWANTKMNMLKTYPESKHWFPFLYERKILTLELLVDFGLVFQKANEDTVQWIVQQAIRELPLLQQDISSLFSPSLACLREVMSRLGKVSGRGKGKGSLHRQSSFDLPKEALDWLDHLFKAHLFLAKTVSQVYIDQLFCSIDFLHAFSECYEVLTSLMDEPVTSLYKEPILDLYFLALQYRYFDPDIEESQLFALSEELCDFMLKFQDQMPSTPNNAVYLRDGCLLLDLDIRHDIHNGIQTLAQLMEDAHLEAGRVHLLAQSIENMVVFSGNLEKKRTIQQKRAPSASTLSLQGIPEEDIDEFIQRSSLISQVQDLFPELGEGFIEACLIAMHNDPELVIMKLLEEDLPVSVQHLDRKMGRSSIVIPSKLGKVTTISMDSKKTKSMDENKQALTPSFDSEFVKKQREIMEQQALDDDDDEYDDTYDSNDISLAGTMERHLTDEPNKSKLVLTTTPEQTLIKLYMTQPNIFSRQFRKTAERKQWLSQLQMTDEQLEGWFIMFERNPKKSKLIELAEMMEGNGNLSVIK